MSNWFIQYPAQEREVRMAIRKNQAVNPEPQKIHWHRHGQPCTPKCEVVEAEAAR
jgi:calcineurin-like phosphoesterase family protein